MADTTITILGTSGAGKTCYLLSMYHKMAIGSHGFSLTANDDTDVELRQRYQKMADRSLGNARFPAGTDTRSQYELNLEYGAKPIMSFSWDDYPGGYLDLKSTGDAEAYRQVEESILRSSCLFICVDGTLLASDDREEKIGNVQEEASQVINPFFSKYQKEHGSLPLTAFVITKWDQCLAYNAAEDLGEIIQEAFSPFFAAEQSLAAIIPVSIDLNSDCDDASKRLKPYHVQLPIFMGIFFALLDCGDEADSFFFGRDDQKVNLLSALVKKMGDKLQIQSRNLQRLNQELRENIQLYFVNGNPQPFPNIFD